MIFGEKNLTSNNLKMINFMFNVEDKQICKMYLAIDY